MMHRSGTKRWSQERVTRSVSCRCSKLLYQDYLYHWRGPSCHRLPAYKGTLMLVHNLADTPSLGHFHFLGHLLLPLTPPSCHPLTCCFCCPLTLCCHFPPFLTYHFHPPPKKGESEEFPKNLCKRMARQGIQRMDQYQVSKLVMFKKSFIWRLERINNDLDNSVEKSCKKLWSQWCKGVNWNVKHTITTTYIDSGSVGSNIRIRDVGDIFTHWEDAGKCHH